MGNKGNGKVGKASQAHRIALAICARVNYSAMRSICAVMVGAILFVIGTDSAIASKKVTYYYTDPLGTVLHVTDEYGNTLETGDVTPFGSTVGSFTIGNVRYGGHVVDDEPGFIYMSARYYDPLVGRFVSADPIFPGIADVFNFNRFTYANNNPIKNIDPSGAMCGSAGEVSGAVQRMRDASDGCDRSSGGSNGGTFIPISPSERSAANRGNTALFWSLRYQAKPRDPWSGDGMALWNPEGMDAGFHSQWLRALAWVNLNRLKDAIQIRDAPLLGSGTNLAPGAELKMIGVEVMQAYVASTDSSGGFVPTLSQSAEFHYRVFQSHNLPSTVYGATPLGYGPSGQGRAWGDWQSKVVNDVFSYCAPGCQP